MARARELIALVLDAPREAGTPAAAHARRLVADHLRALGYRVEEQPFSFFPSSLNALPMFGAGLGWLTLLQIPLVTVPGAPPWAALGAWLAGLGALAMLVRGTALGWSSLGGGVREDANLIATRGTAPVRRWIVAHLDTKAQGQSMAGRVVAVVVAALAIATLTVLAVLRIRGPLGGDTVAYAAVLTLSACGLAARGALRGTSPGRPGQWHRAPGGPGGRGGRPARGSASWSPARRSSGWWARGSSPGNTVRSWSAWR
ncbi:MAG: hypothetical protein R2910_03670 [Gemmatimonadales bacterium]